MDLLKQNEQKRIVVSILRILYGNDRNVRHIRVKNHTLINQIIEETFANKTDIPLLTALRQIIVRYISVQENRDDLNQKSKQLLAAMLLTKSNSLELVSATTV